MASRRYAISAIGSRRGSASQVLGRAEAHPAPCPAKAAPACSAHAVMTPRSTFGPGICTRSVREATTYVHLRTRSKEPGGFGLRFWSGERHATLPCAHGHGAAPSASSAAISRPHSACCGSTAYGAFRGDMPTHWRSPCRGQHVHTRHGTFRMCETGLGSMLAGAAARGQPRACASLLTRHRCPGSSSDRRRHRP